MRRMNMRSASVRLVGSVVVAASAVTAAALPAQALDGNGSQDQSVTQPVLLWLILIGVPVLVMGVIALLSLAPTWTQSGRYTPGSGWFAEPLILGASEDELLALPSAATTSSDIVVADPGGVSARW